MEEKSVTSRKVYWKFYLIETPLLYEKEQNDMPEWKKCWKKLLMKDDSVIEIQESRKKYNDIPRSGQFIFYNLLSKDDKERYDSLSKDCKRVVDSSIALKHMKHTYNSDENSITVTLEQVLDSPREELLTFVNNVFNIKAIYIEKCSRLTVKNIPHIAMWKVSRKRMRTSRPYMAGTSSVLRRNLGGVIISVSGEESCFILYWDVII